MEWIKIGEVCAVDKTKGMVSVSFGDEDDVSTGLVPYLAFGREYKMPNVGDVVLAAKVANKSCDYVIIGTFWNEKNKPQINQGDLYKKELSNQSHILVNSDGCVEIKSNNDIRIKSNEGIFSVNDYIRRSRENG